MCRLKKQNARRRHTEPRETSGPKARLTIGFPSIDVHLPLALIVRLVVLFFLTFCVSPGITPATRAAKKSRKHNLLKFGLDDLIVVL